MAIALLLGAFLASAVLGMLALFSIGDSPAGVGAFVVVGIGSLVLLLRWGWRWISRRLVFAIELGPTEILIGQGRRRRAVPYEDVEMIVLSPPPQSGKRQEQWIRIVTSRGSFRVFLDGQEEACAMELYGTRCPHAVLVDPMGQEHIPDTTCRPIRNLSSMTEIAGKSPWVLPGWRCS